MAQLCNLHLTPVVVVFPAGLRSADQSWACVCVCVHTWNKTSCLLYEGFSMCLLLFTIAALRQFTLFSTLKILKAYN